MTLVPFIPDEFLIAEDLSLKLVVVLYGFSLTGQLFVVGLLTALAGDAAEHSEDPVEHILDADSNVEIAAVVGKVVVIAPVAEELVFRFWPYILLTAAGAGPAKLLVGMWAASVIWAAGHNFPAGLLTHTPGAIVHVALVAGGHLWVAIAVHATHNAAIMTIVLAHEQLAD